MTSQILTIFSNNLACLGKCTCHSRLVTLCDKCLDEGTQGRPRDNQNFAEGIHISFSYPWCSKRIIKKKQINCASAGLEEVKRADQTNSIFSEQDDRV